MGYLFRNILLMIGGVLVIMQFIPAERTNPDLDVKLDLLESEAVPVEVAQILKSACYDCHSNETVWPWYAYTAPAKWVISHHVEEGRSELNFSTWQSYDNKKKDHKLEECEEAITEGWMPEGSYVTLHNEAKLSDEQRALLLSYFSELRAKI